MKALILAGGFATRLWPLTMNKAKPLLPIADKSIISHIIDKIPADIPIVVSTNKAFQDDFFAWRKTHADRNITVFIEDSKDDSGKKGALGAIRLVINEFKIDDDLLVIAGDNYFSFQITDFINAFDGRPMLAAYDVRSVDEAKKYGVVITDGKRIVDFQEKPAQPKSTLASTGCYLYPQKILNHIISAAEQMPDVLGGPFNYFLEHDIPADIYAFDEYWNDIGTFNAYVDAHMSSGCAHVPEHLAQDHLGNTFEGVNYIDADCIIKNCHIKDSIVLSGSRLHNCAIKESIIDKECEFHNLELSKEIVKQKTVVFN
jgi:glucose-1-phosphate thymidylyltransferase